MECDEQGGDYRGDGTTCEDECPAGACCFGDGTCSYLSEDLCGQQGGFFQASRTCATGGCEPADDCEDAPVVSDGAYPYSTRGARHDGPFLPEECDEGNGTRLFYGVWIRYAASCDGVATASVCDSTFDTRLVIYEEDEEACPGAFVGCNDDACGEGGTRSEISFPVNAGEIYIIRIGGPNLDGGGDGVLVLECQ